MKPHIEELELRNVPSGWAGAFLTYPQAVQLPALQQVDSIYQRWAGPVDPRYYTQYLPQQYWGQLLNPGNETSFYGDLGSAADRASSVPLINAAVFLYQHGQLDNQDIQAFFEVLPESQAIEQLSDQYLIAFALIQEQSNS